jgi:hypothetical protein
MIMLLTLPLRREKIDLVSLNALELFLHFNEQGLYKLLNRALDGETATSPDIIPFGGVFTNQKGRTGTYAPYRNANCEIRGVIANIAGRN